MIVSAALRTLRRRSVQALMAPRSAFARASRPDVRAPGDYVRFMSEGLTGAPQQDSGGEGRPLAVLTAYMPLVYSLKVEGLIAAGLRARGWRVEALTPWSVLPWADAYHGTAHGLTIRCYEDFVDPLTLAGIESTLRSWFRPGVVISFGLVKSWIYRGVPVGIHSLASVAAANAEGRVEFTGPSAARLRRVLRRSMLWVAAAQRYLDRIKPDLLVSNEKGFVGTCEMFYVAIQRGIDFVQWVNCQEPDSIMLKRYKPENARDHPFSMGRNAWATVAAQTWDEGNRTAFHAMLRKGYQDGEWFQYKRLTDGQHQAGARELYQALGLDADKRTAIIYSHILSDANLFYGSDLFENGYEEWLVETVRAAMRNHAVNWVLKIHPANRARNARLGYDGEYGEILALKRAFGGLPERLRIVRPEEKVSPLSFFGITDWGLTVRGTIGLELPCFGTPVLTAGTGRYSGKGFTEDFTSAGDYLAAVQNIQQIQRLAPARIELAIKYAVAVFRRRPARYGDVLVDSYTNPGALNPERDLGVRDNKQTLREVLATGQIREIMDFVTDPRQEDFLGPAARL